MEVEWLEDFLTVLEHGSFSRAADVRHVTQSAISRRIRSLEEWVGTPLIERTTHTTKLTPAGEAFHTTAGDILRRLSAGRSEALELAQKASEMLRFASTNALSLGFFPTWLRHVEEDLPFDIGIQLVANHMEACERMMVQGQSQFLLCHHHPAAESLLNPGQFRSLHIGNDVLIPVSIPAAAGSAEPLFALPGSRDRPLSHLSYRSESGMGRIVAAAQKTSPRQAWLKPVFASHLAKLMVRMALDGRGMGWAPRSLVEDALSKGKLVRAGNDDWDIPMEIHLFRSRTRQSTTAERFWTHAESCSVIEDGVPLNDADAQFG